MNKKCVICGEVFLGYGNNPAPLKEKGTCCDICNETIVMPTRLSQIARGELNEHN